MLDAEYLPGQRVEYDVSRDCEGETFAPAVIVVPEMLHLRRRGWTRGYKIRVHPEGPAARPRELWVHEERVRRSRLRA